MICVPCVCVCIICVCARMICQWLLYERIWLLPFFECVCVYAARMIMYVCVGFVYEFCVFCACCVYDLCMILF